MTEAETKTALEDESKIGSVLLAIAEVFRRGYPALLPKALGFLEHSNEVFRAEAIGSYFNFMPAAAIAEVSRAFRMLKDDPSRMVRSAAADALSCLNKPRFKDRVDPALRRDIL